MQPILSIDDLSVSFEQRRSTVAAVRNVSLRMHAAECLAIVGESGSGKTQMFIAALGLLPRNAAASGSVWFAGQELLRADAATLAGIRGSKVAMIFQDPTQALTPHLRVGTQMSEALVAHRGVSWQAARASAARMLDRVQVPQIARRLREYPYQLSGGLRQRIMIGMSLMCDPALLIADEPTSALDTTAQAQIVGLLQTLQRQRGMGLVFVSHDLALVAQIADRVVVLYAGRVVEIAARADLYANPRHPYSAELLQCAPHLSGAIAARMPTLMGEPPRPGELHSGCDFAPRCPRAQPRCRTERPLLRPVARSFAACHFAASA